MLNRLLIREKLNLLVLAPLLMVLILLVPVLAARIEDAQLSRATTNTVNAAREVSALVQDVQTARLLSVAFLVPGANQPANNLVVQLSTVNDTRANLLRTFAGTDNQQLLAAIRSADLTATSRAVLAHKISDVGAVGAFGAVVDRLIDSLQLSRQRTATATDAWSLAGLDALLRANEAASRGGAMLMIAASDPPNRNAALGQTRSLGTVEAAQVARFQDLSNASAVGLFQSAATGPGAQRLADAASQVGLAGAAVPQGGIASSVFAAVQSQTALRQIVEGQIVAAVGATAVRSAQTATVGAVALTLGGAALFITIVLLSLAIGRSISVPLRRLTGAAGTVADVAEEELLRVADEDAGPEEVPRLAAIGIHTKDEIGDLAAAFNRVQTTAAMLLERQVAGRRNVAAMFASVGRRTTNLVGRQLALIDTLEQSEDDPDTLSTLYRLDHVSTRLRRNANSLVVLSGGSEGGGEGRPLSLADAVRGALGSVEEFQRVTLVDLPELQMAPGAVADVVLLFAELIENAVLYSPPHTGVQVSGALREDGGCLVRIVDHGIGMPPERIVEENARLKRRERLDLTPTDVLGLFVVGRIARRHGITVTLAPTSGRGLTAQVLLPSSVVVTRPLTAPPVPAPAAAPEPAAPAPPAAAPTPAPAPAPAPATPVAPPAAAPATPVAPPAAAPPAAAPPAAAPPAPAPPPAAPPPPVQAPAAASSSGWFTRVQEPAAPTVPGIASAPEPVSGPAAGRVPAARPQRRGSGTRPPAEGVGWPPEAERAGGPARAQTPPAAAEPAVREPAAAQPVAEQPAPAARAVAEPVVAPPAPAPAPPQAAPPPPPVPAPAPPAPAPAPPPPVPAPAPPVPAPPVPTPPAGPQPVVAEPAVAPSPARPGDVVRTPPPAARTGAPVPETAPARPRPPARLTRRMPGATLAALEAQSAGPPPARRDRITVDPAEAVQVILDVEEGIRRAGQGDVRPVPGERQEATVADGDGGRPAALPGNGSPPASEAPAGGLRRRVPGAALADLEREPPPRVARTGRVRPAHPEQVRVWVEEFEAGVARADTTGRGQGPGGGGGKEDGDSR